MKLVHLSARQIKNSFLLLLFLLPGFSSFSQIVVRDAELNQMVLIGNVEKYHFSDSVWFENNLSMDSIGEVLKSKIDSCSKNIKVKVYFGSWCSDSHRWVPYFISLIEGTLLEERVDLIALPKDIILRDSIAQGMAINKVPTFVIYKNDTELGRIIENPIGHFAVDFLSILKKHALLEEGY